MPTKYSTPAYNKGMTFIEVLVALVILVTGIFGAVAMQAAAKKGSFDAMQRSIASSLAQDIIERMRSNDVAPVGGVLANYENNNYGTLGLPAPANRCNSIANLCSAAERVTNDQYEWEQALLGGDVKKGSITGPSVGGLMNARGCIDVTGNAVTVAVSWEGREAINDGAAGDAIACGDASDKRRQILIQAFIF
jgi:type IV pilus assembly protein PilV